VSRAEFSVFPDCREPPSESEIGFADAAKQIRSELFSIALLEQVKIKWRGPCKKEHVLKVAVIIALQLAESDIVRVHHEKMEVFEETFIDRGESLLILVRNLDNANEV
jgi:hypothetical protein